MTRYQIAIACSWIVFGAAVAFMVAHGEPPPERAFRDGDLVSVRLDMRPAIVIDAKWTGEVWSYFCRVPLTCGMPARSVLEEVVEGSMPYSDGWFREFELERVDE